MDRVGQTRDNAQIMTSDRTVLVCQGKTCLQDGSRAVLGAFQQQAQINITVKSSGCTGECGSGPMVIVLPDKVWYSRVKLKDVSLIVSQHLQDGKPVSAKLYSKYHPSQQSVLIWVVISTVCLLIFGILFWFIASQTYYF